MKKNISTAKLILCAALLSSCGAWANIGKANINMPPAPPVTVNLGGSPEMGASQSSNGQITVIQAFQNEQLSLSQMDGASIFWLGMLGVLGVTLFATGTALIAQSTQSAQNDAPKAVQAAKTRVAQVVSRAVRTPAAV